MRGFVPDLHAHLAACDAAVVQGGLATTMELRANRRPFIYVPLEHHYEQLVHVDQRLRRHHAGRCMRFADSEPEPLAQAIVEQLATQTNYRPLDPHAATRAAGLIAELL